MSVIYDEQIHLFHVLEVTLHCFCIRSNYLPVFSCMLLLACSNEGRKILQLPAWIWVCDFWLSTACLLVCCVTVCWNLRLWMMVNNVCIVETVLGTYSLEMITFQADAYQPKANRWIPMVKLKWVIFQLLERHRQMRLRSLWDRILMHCNVLMLTLIQDSSRQHLTPLVQNSLI